MLTTGEIIARFEAISCEKRHTTKIEIERLIADLSAKPMVPETWGLNDDTYRMALRYLLDMADWQAAHGKEVKP
mgnify:CR=1 FL=1